MPESSKLNFNSSLENFYFNQQSPIKRDSVFFNLDTLKSKIESLFGKELCNKLSVFITGSDARQEANPQLKKI